MKRDIGGIMEKYGLIFLIGFTAVLYLGYYGYNMALWWDEAVYLSLAESLVTGGGYSMNTGLESFRPPLLPALTAGIWSVTGINEAFVFMIPPLFAIFSVFITYLLAKRYYGFRTAFWSSFMLATSFQFLFHSERFITEPIFVFLTTAAFLVFVLGTERKPRYYFPLTGLLIALAFLTRYAGILLFSVYFFYPVYLFLKEKKNLFMRWDYWAGIAVFMAALIPWFLNGIANYGSAFGALLFASGTVDVTYLNLASYFYFLNWFEIFGLVGIFALPGIYMLLRRREKQDIGILLMIAASLAFFMFIVARKEARYLLHYFSFFYIIIAIGIEWTRTGLKKYKVPFDKIFIVMIGILILLNLTTGFVVMTNTQHSGTAIKEAGNYIRGRIGPDGTILCNNMPPMHYYTGHLVHFFPEEELINFTKDYDVAFIVIDIYEPTYPDYIWGEDGNPSNVFESFTLEREFQEFGETIVWVYRV